MTSTDTRGTVVGAIGGLAAGYVLWLVAYSIGDDTTTVSSWSPIVLVLSGENTVYVAETPTARLWASFAFGLPILPVVLTLAVLADISF